MKEKFLGEKKVPENSKGYEEDKEMPTLRTPEGPHEWPSRPSPSTPPTPVARRGRTLPNACRIARRITNHPIHNRNGSKLRIEGVRPNVERLVVPVEGAEESVPDRPLRPVMVEDELVVLEIIRQLVVAQEPEVTTGVSPADRLSLSNSRRSGDGDPPHAPPASTFRRRRLHDSSGTRRGRATATKSWWVGGKKAKSKGEKDKMVQLLMYNDKEALPSLIIE